MPTDPNPHEIPLFHGDPILDHTPRQAFRVDPQEVLFAVKHQFERPEMALRELGQNAQDADARTILVTHRHENGHWLMDFRDDGHGMTLEIIRNHYLRLFDSSKEEATDKTGRFSLGRVSLLLYAPRRIEVLTMAENHPGYWLIIDGQALSGELHEVTPEEARAHLGGHPSGTLVRMAVPVADEKAFAELVNNANTALTRYLRWITPATTITQVKYTPEQGLTFPGVKKINQEMRVPGRLSATCQVQLASGLGEARLAMGLSGEKDDDLAPITLCTGRIPMEMPAGLPWTGNAPFALHGLRIIVDSFQFQCNIGRNKVFPSDFTAELFPKLWQVVIDRFVVPLARGYATPSFRALAGYAQEITLRNLFSHFCVLSRDHGFPLPEALLTTPFIPAFNRYHSHSLLELDRSEGPIFHTWETPSGFELMDDGEEQEERVTCLSMNNMHWEFRRFLEQRYPLRFQPKEQAIRIHQDDELLPLVLGLDELLDYQSTGQPRPFHLPAMGEMGHARIELSRFAYWNGKTEKRTAALYLRNSGTCHLNGHHPHIVNLLKLAQLEQGRYRRVAAHFLIREAIFAQGVTLSMNTREQMLTRDMERRFGAHGHTGPHTQPNEEFLNLLRGVFANDGKPVFVTM